MIKKEVRVTEGNSKYNVNLLFLFTSKNIEEKNRVIKTPME